ncbi:putative HAF family extracellular repeat protein [Nitrosospira sp. Nsp2]|uniref:PEP-CTERM sorting domain-containing protein n=1 Tax=Nitrosospira sp. Nsp2 TaxID=136548 RepID=UPI000D30A457|nr:PEP-CTERM sorting domain-containing protein [Nitrosospira sp. Nsp2]PTR16029.1 putative HAF family extracellular repeat protein [Nitrosospira sp. Nsp2]
MNIHHCYTLRNLILAAVLTIGFASSALAQERAFLVDLNSKEATDLGTLGGDFSFARGINDMGQVVGESVTDNGQVRAFITGPDGVGMTDLGTLGGDVSIAYGINDAGQVAGGSDIVNGGTHAFLTGPEGVGMTDLGTLGGDYSFASGINDAGQVVGYSYTDKGQFDVFITGANGGGMTDLGSLVSPPPGFAYFAHATAINNHGQLAAVAVVPEPEMYAMLLSGLGLIGFLAPGRATAWNLPSKA